MSRSNFRTVESLYMGRYLVSEKNFEQGDVIWKEAPLVTGPTEGSGVSPGEAFESTCITCFKIVINEGMSCRRCGWPCCSAACSENGIHKNFECAIFKKRKIPVTYIAFRNIMFVRFVMHKWKNPEKYEQFLTFCSEYSKEDSLLSKRLEQKSEIAWNFLKFNCKLDITISEVLKIVKICQINGFDISCQVKFILRYSGEGLFEKSSLFAHSCSPNLEFSFPKCTDDNGGIVWNVLFQARKAIQKGEMLTISYGSPALQLGTIPRQASLCNLRNFVCRCCRCLDKTEEDSYFSALVCPKCKDYLLPVDPIETKQSPWRCNGCKSRKSARWVRKTIGELSERPPLLYEMDSPTSESLAFADNFIETYGGSTLHRSHYLIFHCGMHWILGKSFLPHLVYRSEEALNLFIKVMKRVRRFLALAEKFLPPNGIAQIHFVVAEILAAYLFKLEDISALDQHAFLSQGKARLCRRILTHLKASHMWINMFFSHKNYANFIVHLESLISLWSSWLTNSTTEGNDRQDKALKSLRHLFL